MNILHLIDDLDYGGAQQVVVDLVCSSTKFTPIVCSLSDGPLIGVLRRKGIDTLVIRKTRSFDLSLIYKLICLVRQKKIRLIHSHLLISDIYGWIASAMARIPNVITVHGIGITNFKYGRRAFRFAAARSSAAVVVSRDMKASLAGILGMKPEAFRVVYNGVNLAAFSGAFPVKSDDAPLVVGSVGTLRPVKGYEYLIAAAAIVRREFPRVKFVIVGDGPLRGSLEGTARRLGLVGNIEFLGFRSDIAQLLQTFDIFALSSLTEGVSISILEAMAASKPVIATDVGGNPEVVENGKTGILTPSQNPEKMAEAIALLLKNRQMRTEFAAAARERVERLFSLDAMINGYDEIYSGILGVVKS
ncbi:MAG: glycosyltransferase [Deltaproteobacteria bacterium]